MRISLARNHRAFAVIVVLVAVTVLAMMAGAFAYSMKIETKLAANTNDDEQFYWIGRGGVDRACWWLARAGLHAPLTPPPLPRCVTGLVVDPTRIVWTPYNAERDYANYRG